MKVPKIVTEFLERHHFSGIHQQNVRGYTPLMLAIQEGNDALIEQLVAFRPAVHHTPILQEILIPTFGPIPIPSPNDGMNAIHFAARGSIDTLNQVLSLADTFSMNKTAAIHNEGLTPLHIAIAHNALDKVQALMTHGANPNICDSKGNSALMLAILNQHFEIALWLMSHPKVDLFKPNRAGITPFVLAAKKDFMPLVDSFLQHPKFSFEHDYQGDSIFSSLAKSGNVNMLIHLLEWIITHQIESSAARALLPILNASVLDATTQFNLKQAWGKLIQKQKAQAESIHKRRDWMEADWQLFFRKLMRPLCKSQDDLNYLDNLVHHALYPSIEPQFPEPLKHYLSLHHWADHHHFNEANDHGQKPLSFCATGGQEYFLEQLLARGATLEQSGCMDVESGETVQDCTALRHAIINGRSTLTEILLANQPATVITPALLLIALVLKHEHQFIQLAEKGGDINSYISAKTILMHAILNENHTAISYLLTRPDLNPNLQSLNDQKSALFFAIELNDHRTLCALLALPQTQMHIQNINHETPLQTALENGSIRCAKLLFSAMLMRGEFPTPLQCAKLLRKLNPISLWSKLGNPLAIDSWRDTYSVTFIQALQLALLEFSTYVWRNLNKQPLSLPMPPGLMLKNMLWSTLQQFAPDEKYQPLVKALVETSIQHIKTSSTHRFRTCFYPLIKTRATQDAVMTTSHNVQGASTRPNQPMMSNRGEKETPSSKRPRLH